MVRTTTDFVVRTLVVLSMLFTGSPVPLVMAANPALYPETQEGEPTATPAETPGPTVTAALTEETTSEPPSPVVATETVTKPATLTPAETATLSPVETATLSPLETATLPPLETAAPSATSTESPLIATLTPTATPEEPTPTATLTPTVTTSPVDLNLTIQGQPSFVQPGDWVTVTLILANPAQLPVAGLVVSHTVPVGLIYEQAAGAVKPGYNPLLGLLRWQIPLELSSRPELSLSYGGRIAPDTSAQAVNLLAEISEPAGQGGTLAQSSLIISARPEPTPLPLHETDTIRPASGPPAHIQIGWQSLGRDSQDRDQTHWLAVYVNDAEGLAVVDDTPAALEPEGRRTAARKPALA